MPNANAANDQILNKAIIKLSIHAPAQRPLLKDTKGNVTKDKTTDIQNSQVIGYLRVLITIPKIMIENATKNTGTVLLESHNLANRSGATVFAIAAPTYTKNPQTTKDADIVMSAAF